MKRSTVTNNNLTRQLGNYIPRTAYFFHGITSM